ncbi:hypothetical protein [Cognataquiflexum rubidum]|uniref:hypothetical protein n=1 Tax=Cognataquiflexum rubidum TaxID=2922273 RepID=UPI001F12F0FE|nr:hypothetical protein [Cognataquiflexum rubidum]MCH6232472.1 hypothetical protein [Cognataquiflexum rubidum]
MKKLQIVLLLFLSTGFAYGQNPKIITIDFSKPEKTIELGQVKNHKDLKVGEYYVIKVTGINQVNYMVSVNQKDTLPTEALKLPTIPDFNLESIVAALATINFYVPPKITEVEDPKKDAKEKADLESLEIRKEIEHKLDNIKKNIVLANENLEKLNKVLFESNKGLNTNVLEIEKKYLLIKQSFIKSRIAKEELKDITSNSLKEFENIVNILNTSWTTYTTKSELENYLRVENTLTGIFNSINVDNLNDKEKIVYADLKWKFDVLGKNKELVFANKTKLDDSYKNAKKLVSDENWEKMMVALTFIENLNSNEFYSMPIQYLGEKSKVTVSISPRDPLYKLNSYSTSFVFPIQQTPYSGVSSSFYFSGLSDQNFSVKQEISEVGDISYRLIEEDGNNYEVGTAILAKMGEKISDKFGIHGSLGLGISFTEKVRPRILVGIGASLGLKNSLVFDVGIAGGHVDKLSDIYKDPNQTFNDPPTQITVSKLGFDLFGAVGYFFRF